MKKNNIVGGIVSSTMPFASSSTSLGCPYVSNYVLVHVVQAGWLAVLM